MMLQNLLLAKKRVVEHCQRLFLMDDFRSLIEMLGLPARQPYLPPSVRYW